MKQRIQILSTRTLEAKYIMQAKNDGIDIDCTPFIHTVPFVSEEIKNKIIEIAHVEATIIFTSVNAIKAVYECITTKPNWKVFTISGASKTLMASTFGEDLIIDTAINGAALAEKIIAHKALKQCVFFCGNRRMNTLPDKLLDNKISLEEIIVYETTLTPKKINKSYNGMLFFSPSAVESFFTINTIPKEAILFAIGKTTKKALQKFTKNKIVTSVFPSTESLLEEVSNFDFET